ncbi:MAG TPA: hypothetical protein VMU89_19525 [Thermomicrobiaceae bacterium]|nr:hypothetical protein [Thermomicrobiaceae bacterium]
MTDKLGAGTAQFRRITAPAAISVARAEAASARPELSRLLRCGVWDDEFLTAAGLPVYDSQIVSVGGGLGSFALVDFLRIAGLTTSAITVLSDLSAPYASFVSLARASQLGLEDRLRSDSSSRIDNIWGCPGYAVSEALAERTPAPLWRVLTEPLLSEYFTPRVRTVLTGIEREAARIGWGEMLVRSRALVVRRRSRGGYFVLTQPLDDACAGPSVYRCRHVHLALGHPRPRLAPDLLAFRNLHPGASQAVQAYEPHEDVYRQLVSSPGTIVLRGSGITASRVLERLIHDRDALGARTEILHLFRHYVRGATGPPWFRRPGGNGFAYQPFSFPKAAAGGQLRQRTLALSGDERADLIARMGGTTTARRAGWQRQLRRGRHEGWYLAESAVVRDLRLTPSGRLRMTLARGDGSECQVDADFLLDATGFEDDLRHHALLSDLLDCGGASTSVLGGLDVEPSFEVRGTRSGAGRMYASGIASLGGALAPVDSFWGLTHAALEICDDLSDQGMCAVPGAFRSMGQWWRWVRNRQP